eukprot:7216147-Karenia_brevis.AAC.1
MTLCGTARTHSQSVLSIPSLCVFQTWPSVKSLQSSRLPSKMSLSEPLQVWLPTSFDANGAFSVYYVKGAARAHSLQSML